MTADTTGADLLVKALIDEDVEVVFGYPGGAVLPIYDSLFKQNKLRHILVRHEQAAVHAAEGYARSTGKVGVVLVTSGPGATNAVTGLTDALMDSIPIVCLTGQVPTHLIGNDAFQEADTTGITRPCTKHNYLVKDVAVLPRTVHEAFYVARSGRPGPVVIDLPKDVLMNKHDYVAPNMPVQHKSYRPQTTPDAKKIEQAFELIASAKKPVFYTGGGVINSGAKASKLLAQFVHMTGYPITNTLMGLGTFPASDKQFLGMLGMHGTYEANLAMYHCDVLINIGARFDDRITGKLAEFSPHSKKIHIDIDGSLAQQERAGRPADRRRCRRGPGRADQAVEGPAAQDRPEGAQGVVGRDRTVARPRLPRLQAGQGDHQTAVRARAALSLHQEQGPLHHDRSGPAPDVGGAVPEVRAAQPLDDLGRPRHHGLRPAGRDRRADRPSRGAGDRRGRRSLDHDEHPGALDGGAVSPAGEDLHPEQPVHGHGPPVAGAAARRALLRELLGGAAGLREAGRCVRCDGSALPRAAEARRRRSRR